MFLLGGSEFTGHTTATCNGFRAVSADHKTGAIAAIVRERVAAPIRRLLVVGCGSGVEAAVLARELRAEAVGVDLNGSFDPVAAAAVDLRRGDATCLEFANGDFDFVYSYHVLEHIPNYTKALAEIQRVLAEGGAYFIGTPNRLRLFAYVLNTAVPWQDRLAWNIADWNARLRGRFRNEFGAHAGYSSTELKAALEKVFGRTEEITLRYYMEVYRNHAPLVRALVSLLGKSGLSRFLFPSVYFMGGK